MLRGRSWATAAVGLAALAAANLACATLRGPAPEWDSDPANVVLSVTTCCTGEPAWVSENYIPEAQVWGDGRVLWVERNPASGQRLLTGTLTPGLSTLELPAPN